MVDILPIYEMAEGGYNFPNISDQEQVRIVSHLLYWLSGRQPGERTSQLQESWSLTTERYDIPATENGKALLTLVKGWAETAYANRKVPVTAMYTNARRIPAYNATIDESERAQLRQAVLAPIMRIIGDIERGEMEPRDVLAHAIALGSLSDTPGINARQVFAQSSDSGMIRPRLDDAYSRIDEGAFVPERFSRKITTADIERNVQARLAAAATQFQQPVAVSAVEPVSVHPLIARSNDRQFWYDTYSMSDVLVAALADNPRTACMQLWDPAVRLGINMHGDVSRSVDGKALYVLPATSATNELAATAAEEAAMILRQWHAENPHAKPERIAMILRLGNDRVGKEHYTTLCVSPDPSNARKADIAYVNGFGSRTEYTREDQAIIAALTELYGDARTTVAINDRRLQNDGSACGPLSVEHLIALCNAPDPSELARAGNLAGQTDVQRLRMRHGIIVEGVRHGMFWDIMGLCDHKAVEAGKVHAVTDLEGFSAPRGRGGSGGFGRG